MAKPREIEEEEEEKKEVGRDDERAPVDEKGQSGGDGEQHEEGSTAATDASAQEQKGPETSAGSGEQDEKKEKIEDADEWRDSTTTKAAGQQGGEPGDDIVEAVPLFRIPHEEFQEMMDSLRSLYERHSNRSGSAGATHGDDAPVDILDEVLRCFDLHSGNSDLSVPRHSITGTVVDGGRGGVADEILSLSSASYDKDGMVDPEKEDIAKDAQLAALLQENSRLVQLLRAKESKEQAKEGESEPVDYFDDLGTFATLLDADLETIADKYLARFDVL